MDDKKAPRPPIVATAVQTCVLKYDMRVSSRVPQLWSRLVPLLVISGGNGKYYASLHLILEGNTPLVKAAMVRPTDIEYFSLRGSVFHLYLSVQPTTTSGPGAYIHSFYSRLQQDPRFQQHFYGYANPVEKQMLQGVGYSAMCFVVGELVARQLLQPSSLIMLEASGSKLGTHYSDKADPGLIEYYMKLGYNFPPTPSELYELFGDGYSAKKWRERKEPFENWRAVFDIAHTVPLFTIAQKFLTLCAHAKHTFDPKAVPSKTPTRWKLAHPPNATDTNHTSDTTGHSTDDEDS
jgi:hypothetical protein